MLFVEAGRLQIDLVAADRVDRERAWSRELGAVSIRRVRCFGSFRTFIRNIQRSPWRRNGSTQGRSHGKRCVNPWSRACGFAGPCGA